MAEFATTVDFAAAVDFAYFRIAPVELVLAVLAAVAFDVVVLEAVVCANANAPMAANVAARAATGLEIDCPRKESV